MLKPALRKMRCRSSARASARGKLSPTERSPRSESRKVIVLVVGRGDRVAKKESRRWKAGFEEDIIAGQEARVWVETLVIYDR